MRKIESLIRTGLKERGFDCHSVFTIPDEEEPRILIAFSSRGKKRLTENKVENVLNSLGIGRFRAAGKFHRLSSAFVHLEVMMGARTESDVTRGAE